ncbi:MAG TPA: helix-turn-helix transcriptional regulator [Streptosporangiaceae bacterium]|nr:helix-turn-helix transcriptional regulator [Streptosporangiaceae bacterium]
MDNHVVRGSQLGVEAELPWLFSALKNFRELAPMQKIILGCLAAGMDIRTTAMYLSRSEHTVKSHTTAILNRLGVNSRLQAGIAGHHLVLRGELDLPKRGR